MRRSRQPRWIPGGFLDNFAAAADAIGYDNADIAWGLARVQWRDIADRERFLSILTEVPSRGVAGGAGG